MSNPTVGQPIRVGIVGAGANTRTRHIPGLQALAGVEIVSVCNRSVESGRRVAAAFGIPKVGADWRDVVADEAVTAVLIGTWPNLHHPVTCQALAAGKHVLVEARMALNAREAREMLAASQRHPQLITQVVPSPFTLRYDEMIRTLIGDGYLGELFAIDVRGATKAFADLTAPMTWRQDIGLSGVNTLSLGIWYEALARWVGHARQVTAMRKICVQERPHPAGGRAVIRVPDHVDVLAEMDCGAQAHLRFSAVTGLAEPESGAWLYGAEGTLVLDLAGQRLLGARRGASTLTEIPIPPEKQGRWRVEEEFVQAIRGREPVRLTTFSEGVKYMEFTEAVALSAAQGQAIALPLP